MYSQKHAQIVHIQKQCCDNLVGTVVGGCTDIQIFFRGTSTAYRYKKDILEHYVSSCLTDINLDSVSVGDNA